MGFLGVALFLLAFLAHVWAGHFSSASYVRRPAILTGNSGANFDLSLYGVSLASVVAVGFTLGWIAAAVALVATIAARRSAYRHGARERFRASQFQWFRFSMIQKGARLIRETDPSFEHSFTLQGLYPAKDEASLRAYFAAADWADDLLFNHRLACSVACDEIRDNTATFGFAERVRIHNDEADWAWQTGETNTPPRRLNSQVCNMDVVMWVPPAHKEMVAAMMGLRL